MINNSKLVSIVTPAYNAESYIAYMLDSVLASTYKSIEIIVVDDGSVDRTAAIVDDYTKRDNRVRLIRQSHQGTCCARNIACSQANGYYLLPIDADDAIMPWLIADMVAIIQKNNDIKVVTPKGEFFGDKHGPWSLPEFSLQKLATRNMICVSSLYRKSDWERVGGYEEQIQATEDWMFWISLLKDGGRVERTQRVGFRYRIHKESKRVRDRKYKHLVIDSLNQRHPDFFKAQLAGPLRYHRSWSRIINMFIKRPCKWL